MSTLEMPKIVKSSRHKFEVLSRIGGGSFGEVFLGIIQTSNAKVAIKFEKATSEHPQLRHEYKVYRELEDCSGFSSVYHFGYHGSWHVLVMDLLGPSLAQLLDICGGKFSLKTTLQIADQMLERLDTLFARHLIHRDVKPNNFVIGFGSGKAKIYCVDFGMTKRYRDKRSLVHSSYGDGNGMNGTPRYASINIHRGVKASRRDDLESVAYLLIYFIKGKLPWQGIKAETSKEKYKKIAKMKQTVSIQELCAGCPTEFAEFLNYARNLAFDAEPNIRYWRRKFKDLYQQNGFETVGKVWDWDGVDTDYITGRTATTMPTTPKAPKTVESNGSIAPIPGEPDDPGAGAGGEPSPSPSPRPGAGVGTNPTFQAHARHVRGTEVAKQVEALTFFRQHIAVTSKAARVEEMKVEGLLAHISTLIGSPDEELTFCSMAVIMEVATGAATFPQLLDAIAETDAIDQVVNVLIRRSLSGQVTHPWNLRIKLTAVSILSCCVRESCKHEKIIPAVVGVVHSIMSSTTASTLEGLQLLSQCMATLSNVEKIRGMHNSYVDDVIPKVLELLAVVFTSLAEGSVREAICILSNILDGVRDCSRLLTELEIEEKLRRTHLNLEKEVTSVLRKIELQRRPRTGSSAMATDCQTDEGETSGPPSSLDKSHRWVREPLHGGGVASPREGVQGSGLAPGSAFAQRCEPVQLVSNPFGLTDATRR